LSTLTKILIVLLTLSSIFLCGIVVTYIGNAENFKEKYETQRDENNTLKQDKQAAENELNKIIERSQQSEAKLNSINASLTEEISQLETQLTTAERERDDARRRKEDYDAIMRANNKTLEENNKLRQEALENAANLEEELNKYEKELDEVTYKLYETMAIKDDLEEEKRTLIQENTTLQNQIDRHLQQYGYAAAQPVPVTTLLDKAQVAPPIEAIGIEGNIRAVDMQKSLIEISIGAAHGVRKNMVFHVTRGDKFICDIVIFEVDNDKAIGIPELIQEPPRAGDIISTNL
jgi:myosin heavy subunit